MTQMDSQVCISWLGFFFILGSFPSASFTECHHLMYKAHYTPCPSFTHITFLNNLFLLSWLLSAQKASSTLQSHCGFFAVNGSVS